MDNTKEIPKNISSFKPSDDWKKVLSRIQEDDTIGENNLNNPLPELNGRSIRTAFYDFYRAFIGSSDTHKSDDPSLGWQSYVHNPIIMNKSQTFIAHAIAGIIYPEWQTRNIDGDVDTKELIRAINVLSEYTYSEMDYVSRMIKSITGVCYMPYVIIEKGFANGKHFTKFVDPTTFKYSNLYEEDIQKQRFTIKEEYIDYYDAETLYKNDENFIYVKKGENCYYDETQGMMLFKIVDNDKQNKVLMKTYRNRGMDMEIVLLNGIPMGKPTGKLKRTVGKKKQRPYPFARIIFEDLGLGSMVGRPLAQKLWNDEQFASDMQSMLYNMTVMALNPPTLIKGSDALSAEALAPASIINTSDSNMQIEPISVGQNLTSGMNMLEMIRRQSNENAQSDALRAGVTGSGTTAREVVIAQQNAQIQLGTFIKNMENFAKDIAEITLDDIFQYDFIKKIDKLTNKIEYKSSFVLNDGDRKKMVRLFAKDDMTKEEQELYVLDLVDKKEEGYEAIYDINPELVKDIDFKAICSFKNAQSNSAELQKALAVEYHTMMINTASPNYNRLEGDKMVTEQFYPDMVDVLVKEPEAPQPEQPITSNKSEQGGMPTLGQLMGSSLPPQNG